MCEELIVLVGFFGQKCMLPSPLNYELHGWAVYIVRVIALSLIVSPCVVIVVVLITSWWSLHSRRVSFKHLQQYQVLYMNPT